MDRRQRGLAYAQSGLTLIELTIVILVVGVVMGVTIPSVSNITRAELKMTAGKLAGSIRFTYDLAARKNLPFRIVFDLDERSFWVEASSSRFLLERNKDEVRDGAIAVEAQEARTKRFVTRTYIESGDMWKPKGTPSFSSFAGKLTPKVPLPDRISFQDVWVAHQSERLTSGKAYLYFFPTGMSERAVIHLIDDDENVFSLWVEPLTGRVRIYPNYVEAPEE